MERVSIDGIVGVSHPAKHPPESLVLLKPVKNMKKNFFFFIICTRGKICISVSANKTDCFSVYRFHLCLDLNEMFGNKNGSSCTSKNLGFAKQPFKLS